MVRKADVLFVTALAIAAATPARAADRQNINLAPGRLGEAAIALGHQTGASIGMSDQSLAGIATPAVRGRMSAEAALKRLLKGSHASIRRIDDRTVRIVRAYLPARPIPHRPASAAALPPAPPPAEIIVTASKRDVPLPRYAGLVDMVSGGLFDSGEAAGGSAALLSRVASLSSTHAGS